MRIYLYHYRNTTFVNQIVVITNSRPINSIELLIPLFNYPSLSYSLTLSRSMSLECCLLCFASIWTTKGTSQVVVVVVWQAQCLSESGSSLEPSVVYRHLLTQPHSLMALSVSSQPAIHPSIQTGELARQPASCLLALSRSTFPSLSLSLCPSTSLANSPVAVRISLQCNLRLQCKVSKAAPREERRRRRGEIDDRNVK